ncbi:PLP-dependent aminotransferase family protein [Variovorax sp. NFACC27]|uniref:MocR-like pyridoxine biosynthesis transcription factor PdxR n=1 Tax=unclassified Variovorax TaxID=663243 RepID=UPI00089C8204|nr:GntR family transcriptional regulator / MocR family aminotransferase [Variovorax sp. NFACC28]SEG84746.1 GntR family transcriptional regulator / MocR family aminotransferase [Variovorax sp. NFACC29]SFD18359.1 GntR family transcriptional regulator / MocR family aminotransferase [Variovorax sp. NFACC26]SFG25624.1 GntR family transcriptional regulator / MocR family aminotransferase [Variovorax sp. NFACC27]
MTLRIDRSKPTPLFRQIYERYRSAIEQGTLRPGDRVASARSLAAELGVARGTIETAYNQLTGEGYFSSRGQAGTVVSPSLPLHRPARRESPRRADTRTSGDALKQPGEPPPMQLGIPALDAFPRKLWSRLAARRARAMNAADMFYGDPCGYAPLREAIAAYLLVSRGVSCHASQVLVTGGYRASLSLVARTLLKKDDRVWIEDPGFPPTHEVLRAAGQRAVPVPVDEDGLVVARGLRKAPKARMAVVTPSHQAPLGVSMTLARRLQLLEWATRANAWIVEDDYDGEYRYAGAPLPALKSLDGNDRVLYAGSFSKVLFPGLALGYLVVPESLRARFEEAARIGSNGSPQATQAVVADFMREGHFPRHLKKMRLLYARRRAMLAAGLLKAFGDEVRIDLRSGGMHLIARFDKRRESDAELALRAQQAGLNCQPLSARGVAGPAAQGLLMGFTNIATATEANRLAAKLRAAFG